jgi:FMN phosphatase YigB (HAD superfamily)
MEPVKLILFDLDDTLVHFDDYWSQSLKEAFRQHPATRDLDAEALFEVVWNHNAVFQAKYHQMEITL